MREGKERGWREKGGRKRDKGKRGREMGTEGRVYRKPEGGGRKKKKKRSKTMDRYRDT